MRENQYYLLVLLLAISIGCGAEAGHRGTPDAQDADGGADGYEGPDGFDAQGDASLDADVPDVPLTDWIWTNPLPSANTLYAVSFADSMLGLAAGDRELRRTTNGGATWTPIGGSVLEHVEAIQFTSPTHVVAVGMNLPGSPNPGPAAMT